MADDNPTFVDIDSDDSFLDLPDIVYSDGTTLSDLVDEELGWTTDKKKPKENDA